MAFKTGWQTSNFCAAAVQSQHLKVYQGHGKSHGHPEAAHLPVGGLLRGDDSCVTRDDALVLKEVPGLGASLDCASAPRRSLHPPSLQRTLPSWPLTAPRSLKLRPHRGDTIDGLAVCC